MDILENGPADRPPAAPRLIRYLIGALVLGVVAAIWLGGRSHGHPGAAPAIPPPDSAADVVPGLVDTGTGISYQTDDKTKDFVVWVDLRNFNHTAVDVQARPAPASTAFARLAIAVLPSGTGTDDLPYDKVVAASRNPVALGVNDQASLIIAGRMSCGIAAPAESKVTILVNGRPASLTLPDADRGDWLRTIQKDLC